MPERPFRVLPGPLGGKVDLGAFEDDFDGGELDGSSGVRLDDECIAHRCARGDPGIEDGERVRVPARMGDPDAVELEVEGKGAEPLDVFAVQGGVLDDLVEVGLVLLAVVRTSTALVGPHEVTVDVRVRCRPGDGVELVVPHDHQGRPRIAHRPHDPDDLHLGVPSVHEVTDEHGQTVRVSVGAVDHVVSECGQELLELVGASVDVADHVVCGHYCLLRSLSVRVQTALESGRAESQVQDRGDRGERAGTGPRRQIHSEHCLSLWRFPVSSGRILSLRQGCDTQNGNGADRVLPPGLRFSDPRAGRRAPPGRPA